MTIPAQLDAQSVGDLLSSIGARTPTPGGGAVASMTGALGAALGLMVVNFSTGRPKLAEHDALHAEAQGTLADLGRRSLALAEADAQAYGRLNELWKLDANDERRQREFPAAVREAIAAPTDVMNAGLELLQLLGRLCGRTNRMLASDLAIAAILADAAVRAAAWNVRINLPQVDDATEATRIEAGMTKALRESAALCTIIEDGCG